MRGNKKTYEGIWNDKYGGMSQMGQIVKDGWTFGLIDESETCEGWTMARLEELWQKIHDEKAKYGPTFSSWPAEIQERHKRIHDEAMRRARESGWDPDADLADEG